MHPGNTFAALAAVMSFYGVRHAQFLEFHDMAGYPRPASGQAWIRTANAPHLRARTEHFLCTSSADEAEVADVNPR
jgi:hypothetical protein